jgi:SigmaK-factor processing regulatory protein BofA
MSVGTVEIVLLILAIIAAFVLYKIFKKTTSLAINAVLGVLVLIVAKYLLGLKIAITWIVVLICAIGGIFGALLVIVLNFLKLAFV